MSKQTEALKLAQDLRALADRFSDGWHEGIKIDALDIELLSNAAEALAEQSAQGCKFCSHPLYAGTKCKNCGREQPAIKQDLTPEQPAPVAEPHKQQPSRSDIEPVAWYDEEYDCAYTAAELDGGNVDGLLPLYTSPPAQRPHECSRSHPHENMDAMCELRTEIARLTNENARLKAQQQEPFAYAFTGIKQNGEHHGPHLVWKPEYMDAMSASMGAVAVPLYTSPPASKPWVGLTDETIIKIGNNCRLKAKPTSTGIIIHPDGMKEFGRAIEAKLRELNGGNL